MITAIRRLFWMALLAGAGYAVWARSQQRNQPVPTAPPEWPPLDPPAPPPAPGTVATWVAPVDGDCPPDHPIKVNEKSGIYHSPGGRFYERTNPDRCYARAADAEADGYRAAKA